MTAPPHIAAGNIVVSTVTFIPETGTVALADVTVKLRKADATEATLTGVTTTGTNAFRVTWASAETDIAGVYRMRWESNPPSPRIVVEGLATAFWLDATVFATP